ncbi:DUF1772 domain-containing protein [Nocardia sp. CDC153]|uniref:anthrone oxygenase family protein n=1 Tax=Nocardia sp. CDC153 TaxID=3112167 RepID=UPI002DBCBA38|nr:DUF1772 domain-containing protein [Nocardia sp. CDC153]MEC3952006.1 DUF1772 domain-containing protein [Nocardia sp. CDC153]
MTAVGIVVIVGSGITAGVLFAVALSIVPALGAMSPATYIYTNKLLGRHWDPTMPIIVLGSTIADITLAVLAPQVAVAILYTVAAVLLLAVSVVSHFCNVPINRRVKSVDPEYVPDDWQDPRPVWRRWHLLRTALAVTALGVNAIALGVMA